MRILRNLLPLLVLLLWSTTAKAQYNPTDPPEPGVYFTLATRCIPTESGYNLTQTATHPFGSTIDVQVSGNAKFRFIHWMDNDGNIVSTTPNFEYTMPSRNIMLTAVFEYDPTSPGEPSTPVFKKVSHIDFKMNPEGGGYLYGGTEGKYEVGSMQTFTAQASNNHRFVNWTRNGTVIGTDPTLEYTVPEGNHTLVANFEYDPSSPSEPGTPKVNWKLTLKSNPEGGASSLNGAGTYLEGTEISVRVDANPYYRFVNWTDNRGEVVSEASDFRYTMPNRNVTLTANFTYNYDPTNPAEPGVPDISDIIPEDMVAFPRMGMYDDTHVQILCETPGATIHYTLDGTVPNADSPVYTEPVFVDSNLLVRAIAYKEGMEDSPIVSYQVTVYKTATPVFTFENLRLKITSATPGAIIRYTTDLTDPTEASEIYTEPFEPEEDCRIKAYASKEGFPDSPINTFVFRRADYTIQAPTFSWNEEGQLEIIPSVNDGVTYYTLDGSDPTHSSSQYSGPMTLDGNYTIRAYTVHPNFYDSPVGEYVIDSFKVETPTCNYANLALTLASATPGATLRYTLDGTIPSEEAAVYSAPLRLTEDCTVVARGFKENYEPSETVSYTFVLADHKASTPELTYDPETVTITMTSITEDAEIRYTIDGEAPTATTGIRYEGPVAVVGNHVYRARTFRSDLFASDPASVTVDDQKVKTPTSSYAAKLLTLSCPDEDATIHYTTDGTTPTADSSTYAEPLTMSTDCTVKFIAVREFFIDSDEAEYVFKVSEHQVAAPVLTYDPQTLTVTMTCALDDAEIRYTIDGEAPTATTGTAYTAPVAVVGNHVYTARAFHSDLFDSETASVTVDDQKVQTPTSSYDAKLLTLSCPDAEATIHYTTDGTTPTAESPTYAEPLTMSTDCTVKFIAVREFFLDSDEDEYVFKVSEHQVATPALTYDPQALTVTMTCASDDAEIRYTIDGEAPTATTGIAYTGPVAVVGNHVYTARAFRSDLFDSEPASVTVDDQKVQTPTSSYAAKLLTLSCPDAEATIHYTTDGTTPTADSPTYTEPLTMSTDCTVKFIAVREFFLDSDEAEYVFKVSEHQVAAPELTYDPQTLTVTMTCASEGAEIRYTIDGEAPTATTGTAYTGPVAVVGNHVYTARAFRSDLFDSETASVTVDDQKVKTPTSSYTAKLLTLSCPDEEATIHYTTDGTTPTADAATYTEPLTMSTDCTVKFIAVREFFLDSDEDEYVFKVSEHQVATPALTYDPQTLTVTMTCASDDAELRYTIDGEAPTATTGTAYTGPVAVVGNHVYRVRAFRNDLFDSEPASVTVDDQKVQTPTSSYATKLLTLSCPDAEATIHYTTDSTTPTADSATYTEPLTMSTDCTVKFIAVREFFIDSDEAEYVFRVSEHQVAAPALTYDPQTLTVTMTCDSDGAEIRYTIDGEAPTATTGTAYTGPVAVVGNHVYTARAFRSDLFDSETASVTVDDQKVPTPTANFANKLLTIDCSDPAAEIHYSIDGSEPTSEFTIYTEPVALTENCTVRFFATREFFNDSEIGTFDFVYSHYQVAKPEFSYNAEDCIMSISCGTDGAEIRYTSDGSEPTATNGTVYTEPFTVEGNPTYKARAFKEGLFDSVIAEDAANNDKVPTPTATFANKALTITCEDPNAMILYTTVAETARAEWTQYTEPLALTENGTVHFYATRTRFSDSDQGSYQFRYVEHQVATPEFSYNREGKLMTIRCSTDDAQIRYTIDGTDPTAATGTVYTAPIPVTRNLTFKAIATRADLFDSEMAVQPVDDQKVQIPTATFANKQLTLSCPDEGAQIRYSFDEEQPKEEWTLYTSPLPLTNDCTVYYYASLENLNDTDGQPFEFVYADWQVATPELSYDSSKKLMAIYCGTTGAQIRYTNDGSEPTAENGTIYIEPVPVVGNLTFKAIATRADLFDSETAERTVDDQQVPTPEASFENKRLTLTCSDEEAQIHYSIGESAWTAYAGPISLTQDCTVRFYATRERFNDSEVETFEFVYSRYQVAEPEFDYNSESRLMTITCKTTGAQIRYTTDGSEPSTENGTLYTGPVPVVGNLTFKAIATLEGLFDSKVAEKSVDDQQVPKPEARFENKRLTLNCSDEEAQIHFSIGESAWTAYTGPIALTQDCTVRFYASRELFNDSEVGTFEFVYSRYQVAEPKLDYKSESKLMEISCETTGAQIWYTTDGSEPSAEHGTLYNEPVPVVGNITFKAIATLEGLFDSKVAERTVNNQQIPTPEASYAKHEVTIKCDDSLAEIHYTLDSNAPKASFELYSNPIPVETSCRIRFFATRAGFLDSDLDSIDFDRSQYTEAKPVFNPKYRERKLTINQSNNHPVMVTIDSESFSYEGTIDVTPGMSIVSAYTPASNDDMFDSETEPWAIVFHAKPRLKYNGMNTVSVAPGEGEPHSDGIEFHASVDQADVNCTEGVKVDGFATVTVHAESDNAFRSEPATEIIDYYNTGSEAGARNGHRLAEAFPEDFNREECNSLRVTGEINREDMLFIATLPKLATLEIAPASMAEEDYDSVLSGSYIKTVVSAFYPEGILKDMPRLTTVVWNRDDEKMQEGRLAEAGNPNLLFWASNEDLVPADAINKVIFSNAERTEGHAERISLTVGHPFNAHLPFTAVEASVVKEFTLPTVFKHPAGWETLTLPFTTDSIVHETAGRIVPYTEWKDKDDPRKPFWLYNATKEGWVTDSIMRAGVPYIISMPNNDEYIDGYSLPGKVTFAARDVTFGIPESLPQINDWLNDAEFVGTFMPVEETGIFSLNVKVLAELDYLGSKFIPEDETLPFGAYMRGENLPSRIPIFGEWSGVLTPAAEATGLVIETPAPGMIRLTCSRDFRVAIVTPEGAVVRTLSLRAGESRTVEGLTRGLYIVGGRKVMVR